MLLLVIEKMKTLKIALALTAIISLIAVTAGLSLAHYNNTPFYPMHDYTSETFDENWWTEMREHMQEHWTGIENEEWFDDMTQYIEEHWNEVQSQPWFDEMLEYMEEHSHYGFGHRGFGHMGYGVRGFGC